ncbi:YphA family membrane protein [Paenibacillus sp. D9]|uniref:YphA family membrane protein n=1 Tax=Paenibacillus TaxID=44249 RepID=UPI00061F306C|nr:hypothetical protein [Paenibacillus sp. D9]KKC46243.1 hypothetical protein VE23_02520 [Paenibacillus sp. D9]
MSGMEEGFLALELAAVWLILLATGWNKEAAGGLGWRMAAAGIAGMIMLSRIEVDLPWGLRASASAAALLLACLAVWRLGVPRGDRFYTAGCALLLGLLMAWMNTMYASSPLLTVVRAGWDIPILCGMLAALLSLRAANQLVIIAVGYWIASVFPAWLPSTIGAASVIGKAGWWDGFAAAAASCRLLTVVISAAASGFSRLFVQRMDNREGDI